MQIIKLNQTTSTNEVLKAMAKKFPLQNATVVLADYQTAGKGQRNNTWYSERGKNLTFSTIFFFENLKADKIPYLNYATTWAIYEVLEAFALKELFIKWPNDILVAGRKIAGVLIENTLEKNTVLQSVIGIGLNVNQQKFPEKLSATSLKNEFKNKQADFDRDFLLKKIMKTLCEKMNVIEKKQYKKIKKKYLERLYKFQKELNSPPKISPSFMERNIFQPRDNYKPFEYPEILDFVNAIHKQFWVHSEVDFTADTQDFLSKLNPAEKESIKRSLLAIAQIEVNVKTFWGDLYRKLPKPEFNGLGSTFAESEFRHSEAYSRLLEVLGYNKEFEKLLEVPVIQKRVTYLKKALEHTKSQDNKEYLLSLILFSILIENVSLFSQFAIILSFTHFGGLMKNTSNIIAWTSVDEQIHAKAGIYIINKIREESPELFTKETEEKIITMVKESIKVEEEILNWIFEKGALKDLSKENLLNFMKYRVDDSLEQIGIFPIYNVPEQLYEKMLWFDQEIQADTLDDFFAKRPVEYTKHSKPVTANDLF